MADADYTYHVCSVEGCGSKSKALGFCSKHYMQSKRKGLDHYSRRIKCSHCGDEFEPAKASSMYCSNRCKVAAWKAANVDKHAANRRAEIEARPKYSAVVFNKCNACSKLFVSRRKRMYCCDSCEPKTINISQIKPSSICKHCGVEFVQSSTGGRPSEYCSDECRDAKNRIIKKLHHVARRKSRGSDSHRKRARRFGCKYEAVVTNKVLERDGYRCKLCGIKTPKHKRGTYDHDAPELDHIIPLSKGGDHSYLNTQCACRKCNGEKADKPLGQMLMF